MQASERACKKYREWLSGMVECANGVVAAREQLTAAEESLKQSQADLALYTKASLTLVSRPPPFEHQQAL